VAEEKIMPERLMLSTSPQVFWIFEAPLEIEGNNLVGFLFGERRDEQVAVHIVPLYLVLRSPLSPISV
jgi:hypothetical protein